jgi:hypothetical protein
MLLEYDVMYIGNISEEFAAFIFRAVQTLFLDYYEETGLPEIPMP